MAQYLAIKGDKTRLRPGDIADFREEKDLGGCFLSLHRDGPDGKEELSFEADGGPYEEKEYFFPCEAATAEKIVSAIRTGEDYLGIAFLSQGLLEQSCYFHAIANGISVL